MVVKYIKLRFPITICVLRSAEDILMSEATHKQ